MTIPFTNPLKTHFVIGEVHSWGTAKMGQEIVEKMIIWGDA